jgi:fructoselysine-6-P-deglycase FrlB-like protein
MADRLTFDPEAPLPGPPEPWAASDMPTVRPGPPWHMTDMIAAEPALAARLLRRLSDPSGAAARLAEAIRTTATAGLPIVVVGCGTSEHGALATAEILRDAAAALGLPSKLGEAGAPVAIQAFEAALDPLDRGLVIGISHEGATAATNRALTAAAAAGARTALVTVSARSPGAAIVDPSLVIATEELDQSWCHTVGYLSPLIAATAVAAHLARQPVDPGEVRFLLAAGAADPVRAEALAAAMAGARGLLVIASGADRPAARELVLKVEEATWLPSAMRDLETFLHGHLPATDDFSGLVLVLAERRERDARLARARGALAAAREVGVRAGAILTAGAAAAIPADLTPAGRIVVPEAPSLPPAAAALLATATPLQLLTERLARARGTNPDPIRRDDGRYRRAAENADTAETATASP